MRKVYSVITAFFPENRYACLKVGRLDVSREAPLETGYEAVINTLQFFRCPVAGKNNLLTHMVKCVEGVKENILGFLLSGEELNIVDDQDVNIAIDVRKFTNLILLNGFNEVHSKFFTRDIENAICFP